MSFRSIIIAVAVGIALSSLSALAWTEPSVAPPGGGVRPPVNQSAVTQDKAGPLTLGTTFILGDAFVYPPNPDQLNGYINWGGTSGLSGYGFRSLNGILQFKNSGGDWTDITGSSAPASFKQYGFYNYTGWNFCLLPSLSNVTCEQVGNDAGGDPTADFCTFLPQICDFFCTYYPDSCVIADDSGTTPSQWYRETGNPGHSLIYKELPDQTSTPWSFCSMNGYTTPYDHQTRLYVVKKPDTKWYVYYYSASSKYTVSTIVSCWR